MLRCDVLCVPIAGRHDERLCEAQRSRAIVPAVTAHFSIVERSDLRRRIQQEEQAS